MDLIYADKNRTDIGVLFDYSFDLAYGTDENNFELTIPINNNVCKEDYFIYIEGTEYGGIIDSVEVNTSNQTVKYKGRTFHGILDKKILQPPTGSDYATASGDMNAIMSAYIIREGLGNIFRASTEKAKNISNYKFKRYATLYEAFKTMLADNGYKLRISYENGRVILSAVPIDIYNDDMGLDSDRMNFQIQKTFNPINHLICLGQGSLKDRQVIHLYLDRNGNVTTSQVFTGFEEIAEIYDYANVESVEELEKEGKKKLLEQDTTSIELALGDGYSFDIGDKITVTDIVTGIEVTRYITKKIVTIKKNVLTINYSVGE